MKVIALISFVSRIDGRKYQADKGDEIEMPKGADWVKAGLAVKKSGSAKSAAKSAAPESAAFEPPENAARPAAKKKK